MRTSAHTYHPQTLRFWEEEMINALKMCGLEVTNGENTHFGDPKRRNYYFYTHNDPSPTEQAFIDYLRLKAFS